MSDQITINVIQDPAFDLNVEEQDQNVYLNPISLNQGIINHSVTHTSGGSDELTHNSLGGLQGGSSNQFYHLTSGQYSNLTTGDVVRPSETGAFYPTSNPSGFITGVDLDAYVTGDVVRPSETGSFITSSQTGLFYASSNPSGFITGVDLSAYVTGSVVRPSETGNFITNSQTGAFYPVSNPSGFITGAVVRPSETGSFLTTGAADVRYVGLTGNLNTRVTQNTQDIAVVSGLLNNASVFAVDDSPILNVFGEDSNDPLYTFDDLYASNTRIRVGFDDSIFLNHVNVGDTICFTEFGSQFPHIITEVEPWEEGGTNQGYITFKPAVTEAEIDWVSNEDGYIPSSPVYYADGGEFNTIVAGQGLSLSYSDTRKVAVLNNTLQVPTQYVTTFNGVSGDVTFTNYVSTFNGSTGDATFKVGISPTLSDLVINSDSSVGANSIVVKAPVGHTVDEYISVNDILKIGNIYSPYEYRVTNITSPDLNISVVAITPVLQESVTSLQQIYYFDSSYNTNLIQLGEGLTLGSQNGISLLEVNPDKVVLLYDNQDIAGVKNFYSRPTVGGTGVMLQGEAAPLPTTIVYQTGDQDISGLKDFQTRPTVLDTPVLISGDAIDTIHLYGKNDESFTLNKGQPVFISSANGANPLISLASNTGERTSSKTLGLMAQSIAPNEFGYIITEGLLEGFDTSSGVAGDPMWLGPTGNIIYGTGNKPYGNNHLVSLGIVLRAQSNNGKVYVKVQNGFEIDELHKVYAKNPQDKDSLLYDSVSGAWISRQIGTGDVSGIDSYYLNSNPSGFITGVDLSAYVTGDVVRPSETGNFITNSQTGAFYSSTNPSGFITRADFSPVSGNTIFADDVDVLGDSFSAPNIVFNNTNCYIQPSNDVRNWYLKTASPAITGETSPQGLFFRPDGLMVYIVGVALDTVLAYSLAIAWDASTLNISTAATLNIAAQENSPGDLYFSPDGVYMFVVGTTNDRVLRYTLSVAWDLTTATYDGLENTLLVSTQAPTPNGLMLSDDGLNVYVCCSTNDALYQYKLSTAWNLSTASFYGQFSVAAQETNPVAVCFNNDGTRLYVLGSTGDDITEYRLTVPYDILTAYFFSESFTFTFETVPTGLFISKTTENAYMIGSGRDRIEQIGTDKQLKYFGDSLVLDSQLYTAGRAEFRDNVYINGSLTSLGSSAIGGVSFNAGGMTTFGNTVLGNSISTITISIAPAASTATSKTISIGTGGRFTSTADLTFGSMEASGSSTFQQNALFRKSVNLNNTLTVKNLQDPFVDSNFATGTVAVFDTFTEATDVLLQNHIPDIGTGWSRVEVNNASASFTVDSATNQLKITSTIANVGVIYIENTNLANPNYEVSMDLPVQDNADDNIWLIARYVDIDNFYAVKWSTTTSNCILYKRVGGIYTQLGSIPVVAPATGSSNLALRVIGDCITVLNDGIVKIGAVDSAISGAGKAGLAGGNIGAVATDDLDSTWRLDNFKVQYYNYATSVFENGDVSINNGGLILKSPNGTPYKLTVNDDGSLQTSAI